MKNHNVCLFVLFTFLMSGCDNSRDQKQPLQNPLKKVEIDKPVKKEVKKQSVVYKKSKVLKKKLIKPKSVIEDIQDPVDTINNHQALDLSLPVQFRKNIISDAVVNNKQQKYLPDFFADKKEQTERRVQIDGKMIEKEKEEIEKQATIDGVGIAIKLTH